MQRQGLGARQQQRQQQHRCSSANSRAARSARRAPVRARAATNTSTAASPTTQPTEAAAVAAFKSAHGDSEAACLEVLARAAATKAVAPEIVEGALAWLEAASRARDGRPSPSTAPSVDGKWRLVFSTSTSIRQWQYIPVTEDLVVDTAAKTISLESEVLGGLFRFIIRGAVLAWRADQGELDFQFTQVDVLFAGNKVWEVTPKTKPKTYTFYHVGDKVSAARSSAGGLSLLFK